MRVIKISDILLIDRTTSTSKTKKNIIWANENYIKYGEYDYAATSQIKPELITGEMGEIIGASCFKITRIKKRANEV